MKPRRLVICAMLAIVASCSQQQPQQYGTVEDYEAYGRNADAMAAAPCYFYPDPAFAPSGCYYYWAAGPSYYYTYPTQQPRPQERTFTTRIDSSPFSSPSFSGFSGGNSLLRGGGGGGLIRLGR